MRRRPGNGSSADCNASPHAVLVNSDSPLQAKQSWLDDFKVPGFKVDRQDQAQRVLANRLHPIDAGP